MKLYPRTLDGIVNDHLEFEVTVPKIPAGQTVTKMWATFKTSLFDADPGLLQKPITAAPDANGGQITSNGGTPGPDGTGTAVGLFIMSPADTTVLGSPPRHYDVQVMLANGRINTVEIGKTDFRIGVTQATS